MFMVLSSWHSHCESSPVHLMTADWAPGGRQPSDQTNRFGLWVPSRPTVPSNFIEGSTPPRLCQCFHAACRHWWLSLASTFTWEISHILWEMPCISLRLPPPEGRCRRNQGPDFRKILQWTYEKLTKKPDLRKT